MAELEPDQIWWSAEDIAQARLPELPGSARGVTAIALKLGWRTIEGCARRRQGRGGGWQYHWSVLPEKARWQLLREAAKAPVSRPSADEMWTIFEGLGQKAKDKAAERLKTLLLVESNHLTGVSLVVAVEAAARAHGFTSRSIFNWRGMVEGVPQSDWLPYLAPRHRIATRKSTKATCTRAFMDHLKGLFLRQEQPTFSDSYRRAIKKAKEESWDVLTRKTAERRLQTEVPHVTRVFAREGEAGLMRCFPAQIRDRSAMTAMEGVNADCHKIDVFVRWPDGKIVRPQIVAFQDIYSSKILSWQVDHDPNKVMVMAAFGEMVEEYGIPQRCLFDNGREFANKWMTAGTKTRFRFKIREDDPLGVLPLMGIQVHWAQPAHGQAKPIERAFGDFARDIAKDPRFHGAYVGNRPDAKPENYGNRAIPLETFIEVLTEGVAEHNAREGRLSHTAKGRSFDQTFADSYATAKIRKATEEQRRLWLMGQHVCQLDKNNGQIRLHGNSYHSEWMSQHPRLSVVARFDPAALWEGLHIYGKDGEYLGFAECRQKVGFFDLVGAKEEARRKRRIKKAERQLLEARRPVSIEQIASEMETASPAPSEPLSAKVVAPEFRRHREAPSVMRRPAYQPVKDAEIDAKRDALILEMQPAKSKADPEAKKTGFQPGQDPEERYAQAKDILTRSEAGQPVGRAEADWLSDYQNSIEYRSAKMMAEMHEKYRG